MAAKALPAVLYLAGVVAVIIALSLQKQSVRVRILNEDGQHPVSMLQTSKLVMQAKGVSSGALDPGSNLRHICPCSLCAIPWDDAAYGATRTSDDDR